MKKSIAMAALLSALSLNAQATSIEVGGFDAGSTVLNFDELTDGTVVSNQYAALGLTISGTVGNNGTGAAGVVTAENTGGSASAPIYIGQPTIEWDGSLIFSFAGVTVTQFGAMLVDSAASWLSVYDTGGNLIETVLGSGVVYDFVGVDTGGIAIGKAIFSGDYYAVDDLRFNKVSSVPEPASIALLGLGLMGIGLARRKKTV